jgi:hypothetical protein
MVQEVTVSILKVPFAVKTGENNAGNYQSQKNDPNHGFRHENMFRH